MKKITEEQRLAIGRWRLCELLAREYPFSVQEIYDVYKIIQDAWKDHAITLSEMMRIIRMILETARDLGMSPMQVLPYKINNKSLLDNASPPPCPDAKLF